MPTDQPSPPAPGTPLGQREFVGMMAAIDVAALGAAGARGHEAQKRLFDAGLNLKSTGDALIIAPPFVAERHHIDEIAGKLRAVLATL